MKEGIKYKALLFLLLMTFFFLLFPTIIKIQIEADQSISEMRGYKDGRVIVPSIEVRTINEAQIKYLSTIEWEDLHQCDELQFYYSASQYNEPVNISHIEIAVGNFIVYNGAGENDIVQIKTSSEYGYFSILNLEKSLRAAILRTWILYLLFSTAVTMLIVIRFKAQINISKIMGLLKQQSAKLMELITIFVVGGIGYLVATKVTNMLGHRMCNYDSEIGLLIFAECCIFFLLKQRCGSCKKALLGCLLLVPCLWMSVERMTAFATDDEPICVYRIYQYPNVTMASWYDNRTCQASYAVMHSLLKFLPAGIINGIYLNSIQLIKVISWGAGFLLMLLIVDCAQNQILNREIELSAEEGWFCYLVLLVGMFLLPVNLLALKNYNNYDMLSLLFGVYGFEYMYLSIRHKSIKYGWGGVILELVALLEKMSSLPLFVLSGGALLFAYAANGEKPLRVMCASLVKLLAGVLTASSIMHVYVICFLMDNRTRIIPISHSTFRVIASTPAMLVSKIANWFGIGNLLSGYGKEIVGFLLIFAGMFCIGSVLFALSRIAGNVNLYMIRVASVSMLLIYFLTAIAMTYLGIPEGTPLTKVCVCMIEFVNAVPSIYLLILCFLFLKSKQIKNTLLYLFLTLGTVGITITYAIIGDFIEARYLNIYICTFALILIILLLQGLLAAKQTILVAVLPIIMILSVGTEIIASAPAYSYFYPIWNQTINRNSLGLYAFWGEEAALAGEKIIDYCKEEEINLDQVRIFAGYGGTWFTNDFDIEYILRDVWLQELNEPSVESTDFYIFDTQSIMRELIPFGLPDQSVEPVITLRYRGKAITARIYRGDQLVEYFEKAQ